jgi:UPF0755 protein
MSYQPVRARNRRRPKWGIIIPGVLIIVGLLVAGVFFVVSQFASNDYEGNGSGEVLVSIREGDTGDVIAAKLQEEGVVKSSETFYKLLLQQDPEPIFQIGTYKLAERMSSQLALDALLDPGNKIELKVTIIEGWFASQAFAKVSEVTGIPIEDFTEASKNYVSFGVPAEAPSIEGFLFPATYIFEPNQSASDIIQVMVDRMIQALDERDVAVQDRFEIVTMASIIQREAGSNPDDFYKVSRVFWNRLDPALWPRLVLESDATVSYGTQRTDTVWTEEDERADATNQYNTYANPGLPIGPIGLPGDLAIDASINPADGPWLFFVPINLATGETVFSATKAEHDKAVVQLGAWCVESKARGESYCD